MDRVKGKLLRNLSRKRWTAISFQWKYWPGIGPAKNVFSTAAGTESELLLFEGKVNFSQKLFQVFFFFFFSFAWLACQPESLVRRTLWISQHFAHDVQALCKSVRQQEIGTKSSGGGNDKTRGGGAGETRRGRVGLWSETACQQWRPQPESLVRDGFDLWPGWLEKRLMPLQLRAAEGRPRRPLSLARRHSDYGCKTHRQASHFCLVLLLSCWIAATPVDFSLSWNQSFGKCSKDKLQVLLPALAVCLFSLCLLCAVILFFKWFLLSHFLCCVLLIESCLPKIIILCFTMTIKLYL